MADGSSSTQRGGGHIGNYNLVVWSTAPWCWRGIARGAELLAVILGLHVVMQLIPVGLGLDGGRGAGGERVEGLAAQGRGGPCSDITAKEG